MPSCERLLGPAAGWPEGVRLAWTERAAALGDPRARLEIGGLTREPGIQRDAVRAILLEGDPLQWMRYSMSLARHADLDGSLLSPTAFFWAGCARIPACAADPVAYLYDPASPTGSMAERWVQAMALWDAPRSRAIAEAQARRINEHVAAGRIDRLRRPCLGSTTLPITRPLLPRAHFRPARPPWRRPPRRPPPPSNPCPHRSRPAQRPTCPRRALSTNASTISSAAPTRTGGHPPGVRRVSIAICGNGCRRNGPSASAVVWLKPSAVCSRLVH